MMQVSVRFIRCISLSHGTKFKRQYVKEVICTKRTLSKYSIMETPTEEKPFVKNSERLILEIFERDDNFHPEKAVVTISDGCIHQNRKLNDYLENLHKKFLSESQDCHVSFGTFCLVGLKHIKLSAFISKDSCLCTQRKSMALIAQTLRSEGKCLSASPETFVKNVEIQLVGSTNTSDQI